MTATEPTVLATSGGHRVGGRTWLTFDALVHHAVELSGVHGRYPGSCTSVPRSATPSTSPPG